MSAPTTDPIYFGQRAPRQQGEYDKTVPIAYIDIPTPQPNEAVALVDVASGSLENATPRAIVLEFAGETGIVSVTRNSGVTDTGPSTQPHGTFQCPAGQGNTSQTTITLPIRVLGVNADPSGTWVPLISRGVFYRIWEMTAAEGESSWLRAAGFENGQYLVLAYTTELDWRNLCASSRWTGSGVSGGGALWTARQAVTQTPSNKTLVLQPTVTGNASQNTRILALGGLITDTGLELLTEAPRYQATVLQAPGLGGSTHAVTYTIYSGQATNPVTGRQRSAAAIATGTLPTPTSFSALCTLAGVSPVAESTVIRYSGAFFVPAEGNYTFRFTTGGKLRFYHWNLAVVDRWYGAPSTVSTNHISYYSAYLHAGWHDFALESAPETINGNCGVAVEGPGTLVWATSSTNQSKVQQFNPATGELLLAQSYLGGTDSLNTPTLYASYAYTSNTLPFRGYYQDGVFSSLDLNPAAGRFCGTTSAPQSTQQWALTDSCWISIVPTLACALTDTTGTPYTTSSRTWISGLSYGLLSALRWGAVSSSLSGDTDLLEPFGSASTFAGAVLGRSTYSANSAITGLATLTNPKGDYDSGAVIAHLDVIAGTPALSSVRIYDIRSRGGGLFHNTQPSALPQGGPQERAETYWDLSPWDGYEQSVNGTVLVSIPEGLLDGTDGGPIFTSQEIQNLIQQAVPAGVQPILQYVPNGN